MTDLIVYLKAPIPGQVKTRLQSRYTPQEAADLYRAFIQDTFEAASESGADRLIACYDGDQDHVRQLTPSGWLIVEQVGSDLGDRMLTSLRDSFTAGADKVVLIGTDLPSLSASPIRDAITALDDSDIAIGPTTDGGFYLIGASTSPPDIFTGVAWSTETVYEQTRSRIHSLDLVLASVSVWNDVDTPEDLDTVLTEPAEMPHTRAAVARLTR